MDARNADPDPRPDEEVMDDLSPEREWDRVPVLPVLGMVLVGVIWFAFLIWPRPPADDSVDAGFLRDMMVHHNQAVLMGQLAHDGTEDAEISLLSLDISQGQQAQVGEMFGFLEQWGLSPNTDGPVMAWMGEPVDGLMPGMATTAEIDNLRGLTGPELDAEFLRLMTRHHIGGYDMATACVELCDDREVVRLARNIAQSQDGEIDHMNGMLVARGEPAVEPDMAMVGMDMGGGSIAEAVAPSDAEALRSVSGKAIRALPVVFGIVALAWLIVDSLRRRRLLFEDLDAPLAPVLVGIGCAALSAALHSGLVPGFLDIRTDLGLFHGAVVGVQAAVVAAMLSDRRRDLTLVGAMTGFAVIATWAILRLVAPADADDGRFDLAITLATVAEAVQAAALFWAWRQSDGGVGEAEPTSARI